MAVATESSLTNAQRKRTKPLQAGEPTACRPHCAPIQRTPQADPGCVGGRTKGRALTRRRSGTLCLRPQVARSATPPAWTGDRRATCEKEHLPAGPVSQHHRRTGKGGSECRHAAGQPGDPGRPAPWSSGLARRRCALTWLHHGNLGPPGASQALNGVYPTSLLISPDRSGGCFRPARRTLLRMRTY